MTGIIVNRIGPREPKRDMPLSPFGQILEVFGNEHPQVEVAVFYDIEGETVDYFSYSDPYDTRLAAAHHGVIYESTRSRLGWLGHGETEVVSFFSAFYDSLTVPVGEEYRLTVLAAAGTINSAVQYGMLEAIARLKDEAGL